MGSEISLSALLSGSRLGKPRSALANRCVLVSTRDQLETATAFAGWAMHTPEGRKATKGGILFKTPNKTDPGNLLSHAPVERFDNAGVTSYRIVQGHERRREGADRGRSHANSPNRCAWWERDCCSATACS